jgi:hypothetical protein
VPNSLLMWGLIAWLAVEYRVVEWLRKTLNVLRFVAPACAFLGMALLDYHWLSDLVAGVAFGVVLLRLLHLIFDGPLSEIGDFGVKRRLNATPPTPSDQVTANLTSPGTSPGRPGSADRPRVG